MMKCRQAQLLTVSFQCRHLRRAEPARAPEFSICQHPANASFKSIIHHQPQGTEVDCASDQPTTEPPHTSLRTWSPWRLRSNSSQVHRSSCAMAPPAKAAGSLPLQWDDERLGHVQELRHQHQAVLVNFSFHRHQMNQQETQYIDHTVDFLLLERFYR